MIGLFDYLKTHKSELLKYKSQDDQKVTLTLKKDQDWSVVQDATTIRNWIINAVGGKEKLELYKDGAKQDISNISNETELEQLKTEVELLSEDEKGQKTIVFEKYWKENNESWMRIKDAIEKFMENSCWEVDWNQVKIKTTGSPKNAEKEETKDEELIGLLKHMQNNGNSANEEQKYKDIEDSNCLIFEKTGGVWKWAGGDGCKKEK